MRDFVTSHATATKNQGETAQMRECWTIPDVAVEEAALSFFL
jgi:hypothetical protein